MAVDEKRRFEIKSADEFVRLRTSEDPEEYRLAAWGWATDEVWLEVIGRYADMRRWVAHNKTVSVDILEMLSTDTDYQVRSTVARRRKLSHDLFIILSRDSDASVRSAIAGNPKLPAELAARLAKDPDPDVRREIASNSITALHLVRELTADEDEWVREFAERALNERA